MLLLSKQPEPLPDGWTLGPRVDDLLRAVDGPHGVGWGRLLPHRKTGIHLGLYCDATRTAAL